MKRFSLLVRMIRGSAPVRQAKAALISMLVLLIFHIRPLQAQIVHYVDPFHPSSQDGANTCTNPDIPCNTISHAIDVSAAGDTIDAAPAIYTEMLEFDKSLILRGAGEGATIIQAHEEAGQAEGRVITIDGAFDVTITGVTIRHGNAVTAGFPDDIGGGIYTNARAVTLIDVTISDNVAERNGGGMMINYNNPHNGSTTLTNVTIVNNRTLDDLGGGGGGLYVFADRPTTLTNVTIDGNESRNHGGGLYSNGAAPTLSGVTLNGNRSRLDGGGMYNVFSFPTLTDVTFIRNSADRHGGAMYSHGGAPDLNEVTFDDNIAGNHGGGMFNTDESRPTLNGVTFINNRTHPAGIANNGGGMYSEKGSSPTLNNVIFNGNQASGSGGGIYSNEADSLLLRHVTIEANTAGTIGGGMYNRQTFLQADHTTVRENVAASSGGGIYNVQSTTVLTEVLFIGNKALGPTNVAGGLYNASDRQNPTRLTDVIFEENEANSGAGVFDGSGNTGYTNVTFRGNTAATAGGGMASFAVNSSTLTGVVFDGNTAHLGGALWIAFDSLSLNDVTFIGNVADSLGGGIYNSNQTFELTGASFSNNEAGWYGGGIFNSGSRAKPVLTDVTFSGNMAGNQGGGMYNQLNAAPTLIDALFTQNRAVDGAGMFSLDSSPTLVGVDFIENTAEGTGGGMFNANDSAPMVSNVAFIRNAAGNCGGMRNQNFDQDKTPSPTIVNAIFSGNTAEGGAGGMCNIGVSPVLRNVTLSGNIATTGNGGGINNVDAAPVLFNTIVWGNTAGDEGHEIFNSGSDASIELHYSLYRNSDGDIVEGGGFLQDAHTLVVDPLFIDAENGNLHLSAGSPAINAGDPATDLSLFPLDAEGEPVDLDGNPRVHDGAIDIGAYEFRALAAPTLIHPAHQAVDVDPTVTLLWEPVDGAEAYHVQLTRSGESFDAAIIDDAEVQETEYTASDLEAGVNYQWRVRALAASGESEWADIREFTTAVATSGEGVGESPVAYALYQNYPNPFNPSTLIRYDLPRASHVLIEIYDVIGRRMRILVNEYQPSGRHAVQVDAGDLPSGGYLYRMRAGDFVEDRKLTLLR